jgi:hypothetical protein
VSAAVLLPSITHIIIPLLRTSLCFAGSFLFSWV